MGGSTSRYNLTLFYCVADDSKSEPSSSSFMETRWCVDDSAVAEQIYVPDGGRNKFVVVGLGGAVVRESMRLDSPILKALPQGMVVVVSEIRRRRAHIVKPVDGWVSLQTEDGYVIVEPMKRSTKYKVIYEHGVVVRSATKIDDGDFVTLVPFRSELKASGKTEIIDGIERVQVEGGWVSMRLREDRGQGARLLEPLD